MSFQLRSGHPKSTCTSVEEDSPSGWSIPKSQITILLGLVGSPTVAKRLKHLTDNPEVPGSIPTSGTGKTKNFFLHTHMHTHTHGWHAHACAVGLKFTVVVYLCPRARSFST